MHTLYRSEISGNKKEKEELQTPLGYIISKLSLEGIYKARVPQAFGFFWPISIQI